MSAIFKSLTNLRELRFILCQHCKGSNGVRQFITTHHKSFADSPAQFIVRECDMIKPYIYATYKFGVSKKVSLQNKSVEQILQTIQQLGNVGNKATQTS